MEYDLTEIVSNIQNNDKPLFLTFREPFRLVSINLIKSLMISLSKDILMPKVKSIKKK